MRLKCMHCNEILSEEKQEAFLHSLMCKVGQFKLSKPKATKILILLAEIDLLKT